jgi:hypothetical protein
MQEAGWLFELASLLRMPVHEILDMPVQELTMWHQWLSMEPRGDKRADWHSAQVAKAAHDVGFGISGKLNPAALNTYILKWKLVSDNSDDDIRQSLRGIFGNIIPPPEKKLEVGND